MLYEPPKTKQYIIIFGAIAVVLAALVIVAAPLIYKSKTNQAPTPNAIIPLTAKDKKIQQDAKEVSRKMEADPQPEQAIVEQKINEDAVKVSEEVKKAPEPSKEEIQKALEQLNK